MSESRSGKEEDPRVTRDRVYLHGFNRGVAAQRARMREGMAGEAPAPPGVEAFRQGWRDGTYEARRPVPLFSRRAYDD